MTDRLLSPSDVPLLVFGGWLFEAAQHLADSKFLGVIVTAAVTVLFKYLSYRREQRRDADLLKLMRGALNREKTEDGD